MNAVVSGQSGVAVLVDGVRLASIHAGSDEGPVERNRGEVRFLLSDARDLEFLEDISPEEVRDRLEVATSKYDALHLALILLDRELEHDTRRTAAEELEDLLTDEAIARWVEGVLHARPLPKSGDLVGARSACTGRTERTRAFLVKLESLQPVIAEVHEAWERIPSHHFGMDDDRQHVLSVAVKEGLFRDLVAIRAAGKPVGDFVSRSLMKPAFGELPSARQILEGWVNGFHDSEEGWAAPSSTVSYVAEGSAPTYWNDPSSSFMDTPEELFRQYYRPVVSFFMERGFSSEESRDLTQETFLRVFNKWDSFRGESTVETWLFQIASNLYKNTLRSLEAQKRGAQEVSLENAEAVVELGARQSMAEEEVRLLRVALEDLPPQMRQAVFLRVDRDLKYREIADVMHVSIETVKAHLRQARQQLGERLAYYFTDEN